MLIGSSRYCVSPEGKFYMIGYRSKNRESEAGGIHDDIYCNSILFKEKEKRVFIFSVDFLEIEEEMVEEVKDRLNRKFGIERECILLCATHNHSSVVSYHKTWYTGKFDRKYYSFIMETIEKSYINCEKNLRKATAKYGSRIIKGYYSNRNHPGKLADNEVTVLKFFDENNMAFAGMINISVHSTVITPENNLLTSELAGTLSKKLKSGFGFYPAMIIGAAGDSSNRNERQGNNFEELERVTDGLMEEILKIEADRNVSLAMMEFVSLSHIISHNMEEVGERLSSEIGKLAREYSIEENEDKKEGILTRIRDYKKKMGIRRYYKEIRFNIIRLGDVQIFAFPGELGSKFGIELKKSYEGLGIIACYTNGYNEYFMPEEEYGLSFETIGSLVPKGESEKIIEKFKEASKKLSI